MLARFLSLKTDGWVYCWKHEVEGGFLALIRENSGPFVFPDSLGLGPCLFLDNSLLLDMLGFGQVWSSNLPASHSPGAAPPVVNTPTPCPPRLGFQKAACPFCEPNTWYKISNYRHQILSPRRSETASHSLLRLFIFTGKPWPNVGHILLCLIHAFYLFSTRLTHNKKLHLLDDQAIHFQPWMYTMLLPGQWAVQSAPKVFLRFWQNNCDVPQQRLYNFKGSLDPLILAVSVVLLWVFRHPAHSVFNGGFRCEMVELWITNITWQVTILTDAY